MYSSKEGALSLKLLFSELKNIWPLKRTIPSRCPDAFSTNYCWSDCTCTYTQACRPWVWHTQILAYQLTLLQPGGGQIMPT